MDKDQALLTLKNLFNLESGRGSLSVDQKKLFSKAVDSQDADDIAEVAALYAGDKAKTSLSSHDLRQLNEAAGVLSGAKPAKKKK